MFFPSTVIEWKKLDMNSRNSESFTSFKGNILKFTRLSETVFFFAIIQKKKKKNTITN